MNPSERLSRLPAGTVTPILNEALDLLWKSGNLTAKQRQMFGIWRHSWGNWGRPANSPYSPISEGSPEAVAKARALFIGKGSCPWCGGLVSNHSMGRRTIHQRFRWHINCLAKAFATDAIAMSPDPEVQQWAREVLAGLLVEGEVIQ